MPVSASFVEYVLEQLSQSRREITTKRMFGGVGIYADELFVALVDDDRLYFKTDDECVAPFIERNASPFAPMGSPMK